MRHKGFTLIELLVVIGIIGMLVAIAVPNFLSARQRASDSKKKEEMVQLKSALRLYYNDYIKYPPSGAPGKLMGCGASGTSICDRTVCTTVDFAAGGSGCDNIYMKQLPSGLGSTVLYTQMASGDDFCLSVLLDNQSDPDLASSQSRCSSACSTKYANPNRKYWLCAD